MFGNPETTPGGKALKFYASVRMNISRLQAIKDPAGTVIGNRTRVKVVKNKIAPPFKDAEFDIRYDRGIWWMGSVLDAALKFGIVTKRGSWLNYGTEQIGQGFDAAARTLEQNADMADRVIADIRKTASPEDASEDKAKDGQEA